MNVTAVEAAVPGIQKRKEKEFWQETLGDWEGRWWM
jgi:hypothetical protein